MVTGIRRDADMRIVHEASQNRRFVAHRHMQRINEPDVAFFARIHAAPEDGVTGQVIHGNTQPPDDGFADFFFGMGQR
ncbi:MAG: hypothetical protein A2X75_03545 [Gallionellales bacterium GWE2_58_10]|nr:MAG: hypothetical protein A2X75_03545 [Gallionellales bacterium GWE2_58_10]